MIQSRLIIICMGCLFGAFAKSQTSQPYKYLGSYTQPAPNVAAIGKFADYPVSYYTGAPTINIPMYNLKDGSLSVSMSLNYHPSGIRVSEISSWVGLGWALNAGGMISRSVRGGPDEGVVNSQHAPVGYYVDSGIRKMPVLNHPSNGIIGLYDPSVSDWESFKNSVSGGFSDCEPDIFTFSFGGYSGKFVFDENRTPRLLSEQDVRIEVNYSSGFFNSWKITTPDGTNYYFGENSMYEVTAVSTSAGGQDNNSLKPSSWLLTRIVNPNTKDTIRFNYTSETYSYYDLGSESKTFTATGTGDNSVSAACTASTYPSTSALKSTVTGYRLSSIVSRNYSVIFGVNTSSARQDLVAGASNYPYKLDSIKIYTNQGQCLKQFLLTYDYFISTTASRINSSIISYIAGDQSDTKRLKLTSVKEFSGDGSFSKPAYKITYQETYQLPRRLSYDQDHWGYSNYSSGDRNDRLTPAVNHPICSFAGAGADRRPQWPSMQSYCIKSIQDPIGVLINFEFEAHTSLMGGEWATVGGLRIKKIVATDSVTGTTQTRKFTYPGNGVLYKIPKYLIFPVNEYYYRASNIPNFTAGYLGYTFQRDIFCAIRQSQSIVPMQDFQGNQIGYSQVKETFGDNGEGGYKLYNFFADQGLNTSRLHIDNYASYQTVSTPNYPSLSGIFGNGHFNDLQPENLVYYAGFDGDAYYPNAPLQVSFRNGQLLREETYDSSGTIISSVYNTYADKFNETYWIRGFKLSRSFLGSFDAYSSVYNDGLTYYKLKTGVSRLVSTQTTDYKNGKQFVTTTRFGYESAYHNSKTSDTTVNSSGDSIISKTYYSFDYTNGATADNVFAKMRSRNMLLPVAQRIWKNNQLIAGSITSYKDFSSSGADTFVNPSKIYALEISAPMTPAQAGESIALSGQFSTLLPNASFKEKASFNVDGTTGKINEQRLINDKNQALIWDNSLLMPVAQIENAYFPDVAFSSFETSEKGNWTYTAGSVSADATSPTGIRCYNITGAVSKNALTNGKIYILSYWQKAGASVSLSGASVTATVTGRTVNGWTYKQLTITMSSTSLSISGTGYIDELRLHPDLAQMTSYTYDDKLRLIAVCGPSGNINYYEYDAMNRVVDIKDQFGNIVKAFEYNYGRNSRPGQ